MGNTAEDMTTDALKCVLTLCRAVEKPESQAGDMIGNHLLIGIPDKSWTMATCAEICQHGHPRATILDS